MRARLLSWLLLTVAVGCAPVSRPTLPVPTPIRFPATWTPQPTFTPAPPEPTATLVIQSTPGDAGVPIVISRRLPLPAYGSIGAWVDTEHLSNDSVQTLASEVQLASGPKATALRRINPRVISLDRRNSAAQSGSASPVDLAVDPSYDGVLLEQVGAGAGSDAFGTSDKLLASVRGILDSRLLIADAYAWSDGSSFQSHASDLPALLTRVDGVCICNFLHSANEPLSTFESEANWKQDVDALAALSHNPNLVVLVATRFGQVTDQEVDLLQPWFDYSLGSFLLGENGGHAYFSFQGPHAEDYMGSGELGTPLGYPVGGYYPNYGMYARHFQHGLVVVNAGETVREMPLSRLYARPSGEQLSTVRLEPHTAEVLLFAP